MDEHICSADESHREWKLGRNVLGSAVHGRLQPESTAGELQERSTTAFEILGSIDRPQRQSQLSATYLFSINRTAMRASEPCSKTDV